MVCPALVFYAIQFFQKIFPKVLIDIGKLFPVRFFWKQTLLSWPFLKPFGNVMIL